MLRVINYGALFPGGGVKDKITNAFGRKHLVDMKLGKNHPIYLDTLLINEVKL